jgi:hypothetical protein
MEGNWMGKIILILVLLITVLTVIPVRAQSTLALQEKCAELAKKLIGDSKEVTPHTSHYNERLDRCFIHVKELGSARQDKGVWYRISTNIVSDVFGGNIIGECIYEIINGRIEKPDACYVGNTTCKTIDEFENLIRPYMED